MVGKGVDAFVQKALPNWGACLGGFAGGNSPDGKGKFVWPDGCIYEGECRRGIASGKGRFSWPSGATFEGEFRGGRMEGQGVFVGPDGATYDGAWAADQQHGVGAKRYANGDYYEGQWRCNIQDGLGRYIWAGGKQYVGEWRGGVIFGRGVLIWANGRRYDGMWEKGVPTGTGVLTDSDGTRYVGSCEVPAMSPPVDENITCIFESEVEAVKVTMDERNASLSVEPPVLSVAETFERLAAGTSSANSKAAIIISPNAIMTRNMKSWTRGAYLGSGSFGTVNEGMSDDGSFFAVKEVSLLDQGNKVQRSIRALEQEIGLLCQFEHENIVKYYGTDKEDSKFYIFIELVTQGSLSSLYKKYPLQDSQASAYTKQILNGLVYLHERKVIHRDIKCANILVNANGSVKLADFGFAKEMVEINNLKSSHGSFYWMAPEVINLKNGYGLKADIWSLGCTVLEMLTGDIPYPGREAVSVIFKVANGEQPHIPSCLSNEAQDFISQCVRFDPGSRPTASELLGHRFVNMPH